MRNAAPEPFDETLQKLPSILIGDCTVHIADSQCLAQMRSRHVDTQGSGAGWAATRTVFPTIPPRVDYELTKLGHSLLEPVSRLGLWARQNRAAIQAARRQFDAKAGTEATDLIGQIANANDHLEARAHLIGRFARGPPPRPVLLN